MNSSGAKLENLKRLNDFHEVLFGKNTFREFKKINPGRSFYKNEKSYGQDMSSIISALEIFKEIDNFSVEEFSDQELFMLGVYMKKHYNLFQYRTDSHCANLEKKIKNIHKPSSKERKNKGVGQKTLFTYDVIETLCDIDKNEEKRAVFTQLIKALVAEKTVILIPASNYGENFYTNDKDLQQYTGQLFAFMDNYLNSTVLNKNAKSSEVIANLEEKEVLLEKAQQRYDFHKDSVMRNLVSLYTHLSTVAYSANNTNNANKVRTVRKAKNTHISEPLDTSHKPKDKKSFTAYTWQS